MREGQCRSLHVYPWRSQCRHVHRAAEAQLAGVQIDAHQQVLGTSDLSNGKDQPGRGVIDGGADDPQRIDRAPTEYR